MSTGVCLVGGLLGVLGRHRLRAADGGRPKLVYCFQDFNPEQIMGKDVRLLRIKKVRGTRRLGGDHASLSWSLVSPTLKVTPG